MDEKGNPSGGERRKESIFWIELEKIKPNPLQPRREFDEVALKDLAESIRTYGLLQPVVVTRKEHDVPSGQLVEYELLAGERRLRASKLAGLQQIPVIIRENMPDKTKLELALVENLQREDLNPIEKAIAFKRLIDEFGMLQREIGEKVGKSREVVANTLRLLALPPDMQQAVATGKITEGHTRPLLMLADHTEEQRKLYDDIITRQLSVREAERISRTIAKERARALLDPDTREVQDRLETLLGTRVLIEKKGNKGKISIEFFSDEELYGILQRITHQEAPPETVSFSAPIAPAFAATEETSITPEPETPPSSSVI